MSKPVDIIQTKIDLRQQSMDKLSGKIRGIDTQVAMLTEAREKYETEIARKKEGLDRLQALLESTATVDDEVTALRQRNLALSKELANWMPGDPEEKRLATNPEYLANRARIDSLVASTDESAILKEANKIYYGKG